MAVKNCKSGQTIAKPFRHLKVGYFRRRHQARKTMQTLRYSQHASLNLNGDWLEEAGFSTGTRVKVSVMHEKLIIQQVNE
ncbi:SymE family type I addiction module toxin [Klebsiella oxytoca]|uniref:SymE family type I addiction module toxin n=1 Tax=Klebsiella oxytoca TaxID=571 RepID=UPI0007DADE6F|nr:SymE family type I addiction module toxin [Klebsiella oxytoca]ELG4817450.1 type I toxin-antitoxin system SymE family toxin [Klebsiella oxytoca]ELK5559729.1 type I toxin-antitoxin system SymE family toxin [Klebsiella oxytoca]ELK5574743.1 type I toxin-antitoxin system SymE family toxin [Klebsiella oxytoca]ELM1666093.1 type I toxin-antitoxin system SymE family toxin [Klebsiella oxytoca]MCY3431303.1 type I toxin-antitoxin system SymE family toxin [Klebsiella oxytoca]